MSTDWDNTPLTLEQARQAPTGTYAGVVLTFLGEDAETVLALGDYTDEQVNAALMEYDGLEGGTLTKGWAHLTPHSAQCMDEHAVGIESEREAVADEDRPYVEPDDCLGCDEYAWWYDGLSPTDDDGQPVAAGAIPVTEWTL